MARFIARAGLADALRARDWPAFARGYNGPGYRRNAYDTKLAKAYARYAVAYAAAPPPAPAPAPVPAPAAKQPSREGDGLLRRLLRLFG